MLGIGIVIAVVASSSSSSSPELQPGTPATVPPIAPIDAAKVRELTATLTEARAQLAARKWDDAIATAAKASRLDPKNAEAQQLGKTAYDEGKHELLVRLVDTAIASENFETAKAEIAKFPTTSVYYTEVKRTYDTAAEAYLAKQKLKATRLAAQGRCAELERLKTTMAKLFPGAPSIAKGIICSGASLGG